MGNQVQSNTNTTQTNSINQNIQEEEYKKKQKEYFLNLAFKQIDNTSDDRIESFDRVVIEEKEKEKVIKIENPQLNKQQVISQPQQVVEQKKEIDIEHVTIEKIFRITNEKSKSDKAKYITEYSDANMKFRVNDLDNLIIILIGYEKTNIVSFFLTSYHRAYELIENKYKSLLSEKFGDVLRQIAFYFSMILISPENFDLTLNYDLIVKPIEKYIEETPEFEAFSLLDNLYLSCDDNKESLIKCFSYILGMIHDQNIKNYIDSKGSFFRCEIIRKNIQYIVNWMKYGISYNKKSLLISNYKSFLPSQYNQTAQAIGKSTFLGILFSVNVLETDYEDLKKYLSGITQNEAKAQVNSISEKINSYTELLGELCKSLIDNYEFVIFMNFISKLNKDKLKMHSLSQMNSNGFLLNTSFALINVFLSDFQCQNLERVVLIDHNIFISNDINDLGIERTDQGYDKLFNIDPSVSNRSINSYNSYTKAFLYAHILLDYAIESISKDTQKLYEQIKLQVMSPNNPEFRKLATLLNTIDSLFSNSKLISKLFNFLEVTIFFCFTRNNSKYSISSFLEKGENEFSSFFDDFIYYIKDEPSLELSSMPISIFRNVSKIIKFLRQKTPDVFNRFISSSKIFVYFSLIYSSKTKIIKNPYLRADCLDIVEYFFINQPDNSGKIQSNPLIKLFNDSLIKENFLYSLIRVFIDSERLGGSNQFYEKFGVRYKILLVFESIKSQIGFDDQIIFFSVKYKEDCIQLINYLLNDLSYLADESIEKLKEIRKYQILKSNKEEFDLLSEEEKKRNEEKFNENSRLCKSDIPLFRESLLFMISISYNCQDLILQNKLGQRFANLINYLLQMFASKKSSSLKIDNLTEYKFNPKEILKYIITIFAAFRKYDDFLNYIVSDERSFDIDNFLRANSLRSRIHVDYQIGENFSGLVRQLTIMKESKGEKYVDFDDAPEEFLDPITADLMDDPVLLPSSGQIVDRVTIEQVLLNDPSDPFNRSPLFKSDLIPQVELKKRIDNYKLSKLNK